MANFGGSPHPVLCPNGEAAAIRAVDNPETLQDWITFIRCRVEGEQYGMTPLTAIANNAAAEPEHLAAAFQFVFYNSLAKQILSSNPALWEFSGDTQDKMQRKRAAARAANRSVCPGMRGAHVADWTELALLRHEVSKQKRHISLRELVCRAGSSLQALKQCFMMGPQ
jgi:hypothetical protein